ncbi:MAG: HAD family hydrolase [Clostridium sp.]|nr:HAD family hydrolase [Clostridium sp.]
MADKMKWLFFDMGSTLVDESKCVQKRCEMIVEENNIDADEFYDKVIECAKTDYHAIISAAELYGVKVPRWPGELECLYPDVEDVLCKLAKKYKLGIIANQCLGTKDRLDNWNIGKHFDIIVASAEEGCAKPDEKIFQIALERAGCKAEEAVMIGDRIDNDIVPAKKLGMKTVCVKQGFAKYHTVHNDCEIPDFIIECVGEINSIF